MRNLWRKTNVGIAVYLILLSAALAAPSDVCIQGTLTNSRGALYGNRVYRVQYYDAQAGGNALGAPITGSTLVDHEGRWSITLTPPAEVLSASGEVWYELAIDSGPAPDGVLGAQDVFPDRVKVESVIFAQRAMQVDSAAAADTATTATIAEDAQGLNGLASGDFATTTALTNGLAAKADVVHSHNLQALGGAVTDAQVPDDITVNHAGTAGAADRADYATTASVALAVDGDTVGHADMADAATTASVALAVSGDTVGRADMADEATTASIALDAQLLGGLARHDFATTSALSSGLAGKSGTSHSHNLQDLGGAATDAQVPDTITISSGGAVDAGALKSGTVPSGRLSLADSDVPDAITVSGGTVDNTPIGASTASTGAFTTLAADTVDTGQGANELYAMDQDVQTTDAVTFSKGTFAPGGAALDQENFPAAFYFGLPAGYYGAQVFTPGMSGLLTKIVVTAGHQGTAGDMALSIVSGNNPNAGSVLSSVETVTVDTHYDSPKQYEVTFSNPASVVSGQEYHIRFAPQTQNLSVGGQVPGTYADGTQWSGSPGSLTQNSTVDYAFETYVQSVTDVLDVQGFATIADTTNPPDTTTARLYNNGGNLYWNGTQLDAGGLAASAAQYVIVELAGGNSDAENATALQAALTAARALSPSASNRVAVIVPPGRYNLGTGAVLLDTAYLDLIGLTTNRAAQHIYGTSNGSNTGVIMQTADNVRIENLNVECTFDGSIAYSASHPAAYWPNYTWNDGSDHTGSGPNTVIQNCEFIAANTSKVFSMRIGDPGNHTEYAGIYTDVVASGGGSYSGYCAFGGYYGTASGTFKNCTGGDSAFSGESGTASGTFTNCTGGNYAFGGSSGTASGTFTNCTGGDDSFGAGGTAAGGTFYYCNGQGANAWAGDEGTKVYCIKNGAAY